MKTWGLAKDSCFICLTGHYKCFVAGRWIYQGTADNLGKGTHSKSTEFIHSICL